jgi:small-conductance mechanosensitive channel
MDFGGFWSRGAFEVAGHTVTYLHLAGVLLSWILLVVLLVLLRRRWLAWYFRREEIDEPRQRRIRHVLTFCLLLIGVWTTLAGLEVDFNLAQLYYSDQEAASEGGLLARLKLSTLVKVLLFYYLARFVDETLSDLLIRRYRQRREEMIKQGGLYSISGAGTPLRVSYIVQPIVYILAVMFIIQEINPSLGVPVPWLEEEDNLLRINEILAAVLILLFTRLGIWILTEIVLYPYYRQKEINVGSQYAINRLLTYFILVLAIVAVLQYLGVNLTVLLGGAAALLVGIGLGLQQTFNDLICGIILLFERTVEIGDVVDMQGLVGTVKKIGIRTSLVETRDNVSVIVPNSKLVAENVVNWSHFDSKARFHVSVGVAYGSDTELVRNILDEVASAHPKVQRRPKPIIRFVNFGDSSLDFEVLFWSRELIQIEDVKSDLRLEIDRRFREAKVTIPFPQRDVWMRKTE